MKKIVVVMIVSLLWSLPAAAVASRLTQTIAPIDCTDTATDNGLGVTNNIACDGVVQPTVITMKAHRFMLVIRGTFNPATMHTLRVEFMGRWYVFGADSELTVFGNEWQLDLSHMSSLPPPGIYPAAVEVITVDNQLLQASGSIDVVAPPKPPASGTKLGGSDGLLTDTGENIMIFIGGSAILVGIGVGILMLARRSFKR